MWLAGWKYRRRITINNSLAYGLSDYQVWIPTSAFGSNWTLIRSSAQSTMADFRFTPSTTTSTLPYWIDSDTTTPNGFRVKISTLPAGNNTIYMYYGNPSAVVGSSVTAVWGSGLVGFWAFGEGSGTVAKDASGNNNNGTLTNGPVWTSELYGNALQFDGTDDYISAGTTNMPTGSGSFTIEAWFKKSSTLGTGHRRAVAFGKTAPGIGEMVWLGYYDGNINIASYGVATGVTSVSSGGWEHVTFVYDGTKYLLYHNVAYKGAYTVALNITPQSFWIGNTPHSSPEHFKGWIDEVRVYNRVLSADEIKSHYAATEPTISSVGSEEGAFFSTGTYRSNVLDTASTDTRVSTVTWNPTTQPGLTSIVVGARSSNTSFAAGDATPAWTQITNNTDPNLSGQYIQYIATFTTTNSTTTPRLEDITIRYCVKPNALAWGNIFITSMTINWTDTTSNPAGTIYTAQLSTASNFTGTTFSSSTIKSVSSATVSGLSVNTTYYARVVAGPTTGNLAATNLSPAWKATLANAPTNMTLASPSSSEIQIAWQANGNPDGTKYIAHCSSDNFASVFSSTVTTASTSFVSLARNKKYSVRVYAANHDQAASSYLGPNDWCTKPGAFQSKSAQGQPTRTGANAFGFVGDASWEWEVPVKSGTALTITAYIRYNSEYGGSATKPKLTLSGKGISPTSISATSSAENSWELLTINAGTPSQNATLILRTDGFSNTPGARFYIDDIVVGQ